MLNCSNFFRESPTEQKLIPFRRRGCNIRIFWSLQVVFQYPPALLCCPVTMRRTAHGLTTPRLLRLLEAQCWLIQILLWQPMLAAVATLLGIFTALTSNSSRVQPMWVRRSFFGEWRQGLLPAEGYMVWGKHGAGAAREGGGSLGRGLWI